MSLQVNAAVETVLKVKAQDLANQLLNEGAGLLDAAEFFKGEMVAAALERTDGSKTTAASLLKVSRNHVGTLARRHANGNGK